MRLKLDARARHWLRRAPTVNLYGAGELVLLAGLATQAARLVWASVTPLGPLGDWRPAPPVVPPEPAALLRSFDPFFRVSGAGSGPAVVTSLQLKLYGTRIDEATARGSAIIAGPDGVQKSIAVGEEIVPGVTLKSVAFDHVTVLRGAAPEDLYLDQSGAAPTPVAPAPAGTPLTGSPPAGAPAPGAVPIAQLRSEILFTPRLSGGQLTGLVVRPQGAGGVFRAAGLREGDVLLSVNGRAVTGAGDLDAVAREFARGGALPITVERGGALTPLTVPIAAQP